MEFRQCKSGNWWDEMMTMAIKSICYCIVVQIHLHKYKGVVRLGTYSRPYLLFVKESTHKVHLLTTVCTVGSAYYWRTVLLYMADHNSSQTNNHKQLTLHAHVCSNTVPIISLSVFMWMVKVVNTSFWQLLGLNQYWLLLVFGTDIPEYLFQYLNS